LLNHKRVGLFTTTVKPSPIRHYAPAASPAVGGGRGLRVSNTYALLNRLTPPKGSTYAALTCACVSYPTQARPFEPVIISFTSGCRGLIRNSHG
jgi:hypothetical protein